MSNKKDGIPNSMQWLEKDDILHHLKDKRVTVLPVVNSTNQYLLDRIFDLKSGDACIAEYQKVGRGRRGRKWISPFGTNLYLSMFWRVELGRTSIMGLSIVIGIIMAETLHYIGAKDVRVKWPNDLYLNDRKLAGILVELIEKDDATLNLVMGIGINLEMQHDSNSGSIDQKWINLKDSGIDIDRNYLAAIFLNNLRQSLNQFENDGFTPFITRWHSLDNFINQPVKLIIGERRIFGIARGIDHHGGLLLDQEGIISSFIDGEISLRRAE